MTDINTEILFKQLKESNDIKSYVTKHKQNLNQNGFVTYLNTLLREKDLKKADVITDSTIHRTYAYQVFSGIKQPSRDKVILMGFGLKTSIDEMNRLLSFAKYSVLYPKDKRDAIVIFGMMNHKDIDEINGLLEDIGCEYLV